MDDGNQCLLDVIGDPNALDSFLDPLDDPLNSGGNLGNQRFPELMVNTNVTNNDNDDFLADLFSPTSLLSPSSFPTNGIQDSIQSAAALAGITDSDGFDDQPNPPQASLPTNANTNQSNDSLSQGNLNDRALPSVFDFKTDQSQPQQMATSFTTTTTQSLSAPIQALQPVSNINRQQLNTQPLSKPQQQQSTITLPHGSHAGGGIQLSLTPQQIAQLQQGGGRVIQGTSQTSNNTIQVLPNTTFQLAAPSGAQPTQMQQPQIVQAIQPNGTQVQLALIPSGMQLGPQFVIRQPLKPGTKIANQSIVGSPIRTPANIQPKISNMSQINKTPINIRPYQVTLAPQMTSVAGTATPGNIVFQQAGTTGQTLQLTNLASTQHHSSQGGQTCVIQNPVSSTGMPVVTMGVSHGSIIVMTQTRPNTTVSQHQHLTNTVNSSGTKLSLAPSPIATVTQSPQPIKTAKAAPKKKKSKKKSKEKSKPSKTPSCTSTTQTTTSTSLTSAIQQQTTPSVSYTQTYVTDNNGQAIVVQSPIKPGVAVPVGQQVNAKSHGQPLNTLQIQPQGVQPVNSQQLFQGQYGQVAMSTGQQIITNIPTQMSSEQQQQYLIQQAIKLQHEKQKQMPSTRSPQQILPAGSAPAQLPAQNQLQQADPRQTPSPAPVMQVQNQPIQPNQIQFQSGLKQPGQNQLYQGQSQLQPVLQPNSSHLQSGAQIVLGHGQSQVKIVQGSPSQAVQNQVQLVSSSQAALQKQQMGQLPQQQQLQITSSVQQQQQQQQQQPQQQVSLAQKQPPPLASGGVHVIRTTPGQSTKSFKNVQELQQWLQKNPQALRQFEELKRQHVLRQQQQQQQQQQSGLQSIQPKQTNQQQEIQLSTAQPQVQQSQLQRVDLQQQVQPQQQILLQKPPIPQVPLSVTQSQPTFQQSTQQRTILQTPQQQMPQQLQLQQTQPQQSLPQKIQSVQFGQQNQPQTEQVKPNESFEKQFQQFLEKAKSPTEQQQDVTQDVMHQTGAGNQSNLILSMPQGNANAPVNPGQSGNYSIQQTAQIGQRAIHQLPKQVANFTSSTASAPVSIQPQQPMSIQAQQPVMTEMTPGNSNLQTQIKSEVQSASGQPQMSVQGMQGVALGRTQISIQAQQQLQVIQANILKLSNITDPNPQQKNVLQQLIQLQKKVIIQARQHLIQNNPGVSPQTSGPVQSAASAPNQSNSSSSIKPASSIASQSLSVQFVQHNLQHAALPTIPSSTAHTLIQAAAPQKNATPALKIVTGANLSPQQRLLMNQLTEQLKKLTPEQQKQLIQQQQLLKITQGKQGGKLIIQPASSTAAANPQNIAGAGKIIISTPQGSSSKVAEQDKKKSKISQGPSKVQKARSNRFARRLLQDQVQVQKTDFKAPFKNVLDAVTRLLPFHLCRDETQTDEKLAKVEEEFEEYSNNLLLRKKEMLNKYQMLLYQESTRIDPSPEMVMIDRMFVHEEKLTLEADRKHAAQHPEIYDQIVASRPQPITDSSADLDTTTTTTTDEADADTSIVQSPTPSTKKLDRSDLYSPGSSTTQVGSEANASFSPVYSKLAVSPHSTSSSGSRHGNNQVENHSVEKRGSPESSLDKSFDESSETDEPMDAGFDNATVTKVSANDLKVTFRKQKLTKKGSSNSGNYNAITYSVQNHVKHKHNRDESSSLPSHDSGLKMEPNPSEIVKKEHVSNNGSTNNEKEANKPEMKTHQRNDSCVPFRKRKFIQIADDVPTVKAEEKEVFDNRTSSSSTGSTVPTPVPLPMEKMSRVDDTSKSRFQYDSISEEERTSDSVFKIDKPIAIGKSDFEFENVSDDDEEDGDLLQEQMTSAINSILDLRQHSLPANLKTRRLSLLDALPKRPVMEDILNNVSLGFNNHANNVLPYGSAAAGLSVDSAYPSTAIGYSDNSNPMESLGYSSAFSLEDSNITRTVTSQEAFGTSSFGENDETSIVDDLQKQLGMLPSYGSQPEDDEQQASGMDNLLGETSGMQEEERNDPDLEAAVNSILF